MRICANMRHVTEVWVVSLSLPPCQVMLGAGVISWVLAPRVRWMIIMLSVVSCVPMFLDWPELFRMKNLKISWSCLEAQLLLSTSVLPSPWSSKSQLKGLLTLLHQKPFLHPVPGAYSLQNPGDVLGACSCFDSSVGPPAWASQAAQWLKILPAMQEVQEMWA